MLHPDSIPTFCELLFALPQRRVLRCWLCLFLVVFIGRPVEAGRVDAVQVYAGVVGSGSVEPSGGIFPIGSTATFAASPAVGYVFSHWADPFGTPLSFDSDRPILSYVVVGRAVVRAHFVRNPFPRFAGTVNAWVRSFDFSQETGVQLRTAAVCLQWR